MISAIGFCNSMYGDIVMATVCCRAFKEKYPDSHLTFAVSNKYSKILPLFDMHPNIDSFNVWKSYEDWPSEGDRAFLQQHKYNIVYHPQPSHTSSDWYNHNHYTAEYCLMHGLTPPQDLSCELNPWFGRNEAYKDCIAISAFPSHSTQLDKTLDLKCWNYIVFHLKRRGYRCIQLGGKFDIPIEGAENPDLNFIEAAQVLYSSKLQITTDTSWAWIGSAYKVNCLGLYGYNYKNQNNIANHLPVNPNATYLSERNIKNIDINLIIDTILNKLS